MKKPSTPSQADIDRAVFRLWLCLGGLMLAVIIASAAALIK